MYKTNEFIKTQLVIKFIFTISNISVYRKFIGTILSNELYLKL
jgi:hypothetical protein